MINPSLILKFDNIKLFLILNLFSIFIFSEMHHKNFGIEKFQKNFHLL